MNLAKQTTRTEARITSAEPSNHSSEKIPFEMAAIGQYQRSLRRFQRRFASACSQDVAGTATSDYDEESVASLRWCLWRQDVVNDRLVDDVVEIGRL
jgi:hypothetical protein